MQDVVSFDGGLVVELVPGSSSEVDTEDRWNRSHVFHKLLQARLHKVPSHTCQ